MVAGPSDWHPVGVHVDTLDKPLRERGTGGVCGVSQSSEACVGRPLDPEAHLPRVYEGAAVAATNGTHKSHYIGDGTYICNCMHGVSCQIHRAAHVAKHQSGARGDHTRDPWRELDGRGHV